MKQAIMTLIVFSTPLIAIGLWLFRSRLTLLRARISLALRVGAVAYVGLAAIQIFTSPLDQDQMQIAGLSLLAFGGVWVVAWLITRTLAGNR